MGRNKGRRCENTIQSTFHSNIIRGKSQKIGITRNIDMNFEQKKVPKEILIVTQNSTEENLSNVSLTYRSCLTRCSFHHLYQLQMSDYHIKCIYDDEVQNDNNNNDNNNNNKNNENNYYDYFNYNDNNHNKNSENNKKQSSKNKID